MTLAARGGGQLEPDVRVGDWSMPWNARDGVGRLGPGIPKSDFWASDPGGIEQVGRGVSSAEFTAFVKSTYRVLLTGGLRGCYDCFTDAPTRDFFLSRTERVGHQAMRAAEATSEYDP